MSACAEHPSQACCPCQHDHTDCLIQLHSAFAGQGIDVTISTIPPIVAGAFTLAPFICPHGVPHWAEPSGEQLAAWVAERTP